MVKASGEDPVLMGGVDPNGNVVPLRVGDVTGASLADFSVSAPAVPIAGYVLLATIPATASRAAVEVQNQSASALQLVRDDGSGTTGTVSSILLAPGAGAGKQGGGWSSATFKGRLRVYGPTGSQFSAFQE